MPRFVLIPILVLGLILLLPLPGVIPASLASAQTYTITDLGTLGGLSSEALGLNLAGMVVGVSDTSGTDNQGNAIRHGFVFENGQIRDLGSLGGDNSIATGIDASGRVVGASDTGQVDQQGAIVTHAFSWASGVLRDLGTRRGDVDSGAEAVDERGGVAGWSREWDQALSDYRNWPVTWSVRGAQTIIRTLGRNPGAAHVVIASGEIGGEVDGDPGVDEALPVIFTAPPRTQRIILPANDWYCAVYGLNKNGIAAGYVGSCPPPAGSPVATLWKHFKRHALGALPGDCSSLARGVNKGGETVGDSWVFSQAPRGFLWDSGRMFDLNTIVAGNSEWHVDSAAAINDRGWIAATAHRLVPAAGAPRAVLLTPSQ